MVPSAHDDLVHHLVVVHIRICGRRVRRHNLDQLTTNLCLTLFLKDRFSSCLKKEGPKVVVVVVTGVGVIMVVVNATTSIVAIAVLGAVHVDTIVVRRRHRKN